MAKFNNIPDFSAMGKQLKKEALIIAKKEGVDFFQDSFVNEGFTNGSFEKWEARKNPSDYKILSVTGDLMKSIQVFSANQKRIVFGSDEEYAQIHNEGGTMNIKITEKSRKFFWAMFYHTNEVKWKWMALTKKDSLQVTIPKRQFIGESKTLMKQLDNTIGNRILTLFKQL